TADNGEEAAESSHESIALEAKGATRRESEPVGAAMRAESRERFSRRWVVLPEELRLLFGWVLEPAVGDRPAIEVVGPPIPRALLDAHQVVGVVVDVAAAAHVG